MLKDDFKTLCHQGKEKLKNREDVSTVRTKPPELPPTLDPMENALLGCKLLLQIRWVLRLAGRETLEGARKDP